MPDPRERVIEAVRDLREKDPTAHRMVSRLGPVYEALDALPESPQGEEEGLCSYCHGARHVPYCGGGPFAELRECSVCGSGEKVADTIYPVCTEEA